MNLTSTSFGDNQAIPTAHAFCAPDPANHVTMSDNRNPAFAWSEIPEGTRSLVLICCDPDVPSKPDDVNQEDREIPADLPRVDFYHWVLVDLPATPSSIAEGEYSNSVTVRGKDGPDGPGGARQGLNNYTDWFAGDADMEENSTAMTALARPGTTASCTTTYSRCTRSTSNAARCKENLAAPRFAARSTRISSPRQVLPGPTA